MRLLLLPIFAAGLLLYPASLRAADAPAPSVPPHNVTPYFEALRFGKVNMHAGPSQDYPIIWTYQRKNLPVRVLAEDDVWKKISDPDGTTGWVETTMLTDKRSILVQKTRRTLRHDPQDSAAAVALADPGTVARVVACTGGWCRVKFDDYEGWLKETDVWGTTPNEAFEVKR